MRVRPLLIASILIVGISLTAAFALEELWSWVVGMAALTGLWLWGLRRGSGWVPVLTGLGFLLGLLTGGGAGLSFPLLLLAALGLLAAWDLTRLLSRLALVRDDAVAVRYTYDHLKLLGAVLLAALVLGIVMTGIDLELSFIWIVGLTLLVLVLLRVTVSLVQRRE
jgi:hypothetical protein